MTEVISGPPTRRERTKAALRARIIESAIRLFSERTIEAVTVDEIAAAADVGKGTIYNYFHTKEDIVVAFMTDFERKVQRKVRTFHTANRPAVEALTDFIRLQLRMKTRYHRFVRVFFAQMFLHTDQFLPHMAEIHQLTIPAMEALFVDLKKRRAIRADVSVADLIVVFSNIQLGLAALWAIEGPPFRGTEYALKREMKLFCEGLKAMNG